MSMLLLCATLILLGDDGPLPETGNQPVCSIQDVDPPSWWVGHTLNPVRLLIHGKRLSDTKLVSSRREIQVDGVRVNDRGTYLFASVRISPESQPGDAGLALETREGRVSVPFRLEPPLTSAFHGAQGISPDDVIYLIMTDRFSDGDTMNNTPAGAPAGATDRRKPRAYHGGDFRGVIDQLPYLQELGITAIWLTPWYDNFNALSLKLPPCGAVVFELRR